MLPVKDNRVPALILVIVVALVPAILFGWQTTRGAGFYDALLLALVEPMDCQLIDPVRIDTTLPVPEVTVLPLYADRLCSELLWRPIPDARLDRYYVETSVAPLFESILTCELVTPPDTSVTICSTPEDTIWFRVRTVDSTAEGMWFGRPSEVVHTIQDITSPNLTWISLHDSFTGDTTWTTSTDVKVSFEGEDDFGCSSIMLSESPDFSDSQLLPIGDCSGMTCCFTLSPSAERKTVYGKLIDRAGNDSGRVISTTILYGGGSHNYPNPFNPNAQRTNIVFGLTYDQALDDVTVYIYDLFGNLVLERSVKCEQGRNDGSVNSELRWDGKNAEGQLVADGGYLCVIKVGDHTRTHKIAVIKR